jgi:hypothetical protein
VKGKVGSAANRAAVTDGVPRRHVATWDPEAGFAQRPAPQSRPALPTVNRRAGFFSPSNEQHPFSGGTCLAPSQSHDVLRRGLPHALSVSRINIHNALAPQVCGNKLPFVSAARRFPAHITLFHLGRRRGRCLPRVANGDPPPVRNPPATFQRSGRRAEPDKQGNTENRKQIPEA